MLNTHKYRLSGLAVAIALSVTACGGGSKNIAPEAFNVSVSGTSSWMPVQGTFAVSDVNTKDTLRITSISENGTTLHASAGVYTLSSGLLTVQGTSFTYLPLNDTVANVRYTVTDGQQSASAMLSIAAPVSDPLAYQQWHLRNTGQKAYSMDAEAIRAFLINDVGFDEASADAWVASLAPLARHDVKVLSLRARPFSVLGAHQPALCAVALARFGRWPCGRGLACMFCRGCAVSSGCFAPAALR